MHFSLLITVFAAKSHRQKWRDSDVVMCAAAITDANRKARRQR